MWVQRDICDHEPWPFEDDQFDFVTCAHTLEDIRDPLWVCHELMRVARAGYIEVPSRLEEHTYGFRVPWVGYPHHRWLVDVRENGLDFVMKTHIIHGPRANSFPLRFYKRLSEEQKAQPFWWEGSFEFREVNLIWRELDAYLADFVSANRKRSRTRDYVSKLLVLLSDRIR